MSARRDHVIDAVVRVLGPRVGDTMARDVAKMHIAKLGLAQEVLRQDEIDDLLKALGPGLHVFLGREATDATIAAIRVQIAVRGV